MTPHHYDRTGERIEDDEPDTQPDEDLTAEEWKARAFAFLRARGARPRRKRGRNDQ